MVKPMISKGGGAVTRPIVENKKTINIQQSHLLKMITVEGQINDSDKNLDEIPR